MRKGMSNRTIQCQRGANADTTYHETKLVDQAITQNPSQVIFDNRVEYREAGHDRTDIYQQISAWKASRQRIYSHLCGKYR